MWQWLQRSTSTSTHPRNAASTRCNSRLAEYLQERSARKLAAVRERGDGETITYQVHDQVILNLPDELLFKIFISLSAESLLRSQLVCKKWSRLINSPVFIKSHVLESETVLICQELALSAQPLDDKPKSYFHFFDLHRSIDNFIESNGTSLRYVLASCDGLVLGRSRTKNSLILGNPLTRKHVELPSGKISTSMSSHDEAYYFAFCKNAKTYKVVHLFRQKQRYINCEIMCMNTRTWKMIDGFSADLLQPIRHVQVAVDGSLYWKPRKFDCDYYVSMDLHDEKFITRKLPVICNPGDRLLELGGTVGLVTNATCRLIEIWILTKDEDNWTRRHSINLNFELRYSPSLFCSLRNGKDLVFEFPDQQIHVFDLDKGYMKLAYSTDNVEAWYGGIEQLYIPHRNTLASWETESS